MNEQNNIGNEPQVFLQGVNYYVGEIKDISTVNFLKTDPVKLENYYQMGLKTYSETDLSMIEMAYHSIRKTLEGIDIPLEEIDLLLYVAESKGRGETVSSTDANTLLDYLGMKNTYPIGVYLSDCANILLGLQMAQALVISRQAKNIIVVNIWVNPNAKASFMTNDSDQCINQQNYVFTNTSTVVTGQIKSLLWNMGNGKTSNQQQVQSYYPLSGSYTIILQTTTDSGCIDSFSNNIKIYPKPASWFNVNDSAQCLFQNNYEFTDVSFDSLGLNQYNWDINNESKQTTKVANYIFGTPGYKTITLIATSLRGCSDTIQRQVYVKPMPDPTFERLKKYYCELTGPYNFIPVTPGGNYFGKNIQTNIYNPVILWEDTLKYIITVNGCTDSSSQLTQVYPGPVVNLGNDTSLCKYEILELSVNSWQSRYLWNDGSTGSSLRIVEPGTYSVIVNNICGIKGDSIEVLYRPVNCRFFLPTAFSPNGDGINDRFKPVIFDVGEMEYQIYNRWGELIYQGYEYDKGWDGSYREEMVQVDAYLVYVTYSYSSGVHFVKITESGTLILIR